MTTSPLAAALCTGMLLAACSSHAVSRNVPAFSTYLAPDGTVGFAALRYSDSPMLQPECVALVRLPKGTRGIAGRGEGQLLAVPPDGSATWTSKASFGWPTPLVEIELDLQFDSWEKPTPTIRSLTINGEPKDVGHGRLFLIDARTANLSILQIDTDIDLQPFGSESKTTEEKLALLEKIVAEHPGAESWR